MVNAAADTSPFVNPQAMGYPGADGLITPFTQRNRQANRND
jgi:hypothetical protein